MAYGLLYQLSAIFFGFVSTGEMLLKCHLAGDGDDKLKRHQGKQEGEPC